MAGLNRDITVRLLADTSSFTAGMARVSGESEKAASTMEAAGGKTRLLTTGIAAAGLAAGALGVAAINMAAQFDASMSTVQANTGASADDMAQLREAAIDAGSSTVYSASEAADAINELGKAGMSTGDILSGGLSGALDLAASDGMEVSEAAELMSTALAQFNLEGKDAGAVADALAAGAGKAQGSAHDLGYALQQSGMVANSFGVSMQETVGTLTAFANAGMIGSDAGTSLKTMLIALANPSDKAANLMKELGINAYDSQGQFVGMSNLAGQLKTQLGGLTQEQRNQALATIFGSDAIRAANVLFDQGADGIDKWTAAVSDSGYAAEQAAAKNDNLKGDLDNLSGSFESMLISLGEGAQGPLRSLVQMLDTLVDAFGSLPAPVQQTIVLAAALAGGSVALHKALEPLNASGSRLAQTLGLVADPMQRLSGLGSGLATAFQTWGATFGSAEKQISLFGTTVSKKQGVLTGFKAAGQGVLDLMGGPWGLALGAAGVALGVWAQETQAAKDRVESLSDALSSGQDAAAYFEETLSKSDASSYTSGIGSLTTSYDNLWQAVDKAGISHETFVEAIKGSQTAYDSIQASLSAYSEQAGLFDSTIGVVNGGLREQRAAYDEAKAATDAHADAQKLDTQASIEKTGALAVGNDALAQNADSSTQAADADAILADQFGASKDAINEQSAALSEVIDALNTYYGFAISASDSTIALENSFDKASDAVSKNGATLDLNTEQGRNNQSALNDVAEAAQKAMLAHAKNGASLSDLTPIVDEARNQFVELAQKMGMSHDEAEKAADQYGLTRDKVINLTNSINGVPGYKGTQITVEAGGAFYTLEALQERLNNIKNRTVFVDVETRGDVRGDIITTNQGSGGKQVSWNARGGLMTAGGVTMRGYASGGEVSGLLTGPGTGTSDSIAMLNARVSTGEFITQSRSVDYYGPRLYDALNKRRIPREVFTAPTPRTATVQAATPALTAEQIETAMVAALSRLPQVRVFDNGQQAAIALAKPFSREIGKLGERGVR